MDNRDFDKTLGFIASILTIVQFIVAVIVSMPRIESSIRLETIEMILPTKVIIYAILGCFSAISYGALVSFLSRFTIAPIAYFFSLISSLIGAWFSLLLVRLLFPIIKLENISPGSFRPVEFLNGNQLLILLNASLFIFALLAFKISITKANDENINMPTPILIITLTPFIIFCFL